VTANHHKYRRHDDALLAGVCANLAQRLGWSVWALRALFVIGLFIHAIGTGVIYIVLALVLPRTGEDAGPGPGLSSPELSERERRISDLERRFRDLEKGKGSE
jgi:phage shock protein PspC (stress-responsive transcriptional regulator)